MPRNCVRSSEASVLRDAVATVTPHDVTKVGDADLHGLVNVLAFPHSRLVFVRYGGDVLVEAPPTNSRVVATIPLGPMHVTTGTHTATTTYNSGFLLKSRERTVMRPDSWAGALVFAAEESLVESHRREVLGGDTPPAMTGQASGLLTQACRRAWATATEFSGSGEYDVIAQLHASLEREVFTALALAWDRTFTHATPRLGHRVDVLREWLEAHHGIEITVADMAIFLGLSVRQLQASVQHELGRTPLQLLRDVRLEHARRRLRESDCSGVNVATIAHEAGFAHLGRFSAWYLEAYGETPSRTLRNEAVSA